MRVSKSHHVNENMKRKHNSLAIHEQRISKVPSLHSLKNQNDISATIHFYERSQKQTLLGLQDKKHGHCLSTPQTTSRSTGRARVWPTGYFWKQRAMIRSYHEQN